MVGAALAHTRAMTRWPRFAILLLVAACGDDVAGDEPAEDLGTQDDFGSGRDMNPRGSDGATPGCDPGPVTTLTPNPSPPGATADHTTIFDGHCGAAAGQIGTPDAPWNRSVRNTCVDPRSEAIVQYLAAVVDGSQTFRIDMGTSAQVYGFNPLVADDSTTEQAFTPHPDYFYRPACDEAAIPVPPDGTLEGETGYECTGGGDCHLTVFDTAECTLYEMWKADDPLGSFDGGCLAVWDLTMIPDDLRGLSCTSADAAGFPILPMLVTPAEVKERGEIRHALRFILPNEAVARDVYVRPATHTPLTAARWGEPAAGPAGTMPPPYGVRLRLRADFDTSGLSPAARAMAEALKEYGMFHADGGNVTFIASNERFSGTTWDDPEVGLGPNDLRDAGLAWTDFEVVSDLDDLGSMVDTDCTRTPLAEL